MPEGVWKSKRTERNHWSDSTQYFFNFCCTFVYRTLLLTMQITHLKVITTSLNISPTNTIFFYFVRPFMASWIECKAFILMLRLKWCVAFIGVVALAANIICHLEYLKVNKRSGHQSTTPFVMQHFTKNYYLPIRKLFHTN